MYSVLYTCATLLSAFVQILVIFSIFQRGKTNQSYRIFCLLAIATLIWGLLNYVSIINRHMPDQIILIRTIIFLAILQIWLFYFFSRTFPNGKVSKFKSNALLYTLFAMLISVLSFSPFLFKSATTINGIAEAEVGPGVLIFVAYVIIGIGSSFIILVQKYKRSSGVKQIQIFAIIMAAILNWIIVPITNFAITLTSKSLIFVTLAPIYTLVFSGIIAWALLKYRLFDSQTQLFDSVIYMNHYLKNNKRRAVEFYEVQSDLEFTESNHISLDFSGITELDRSAVNMIKSLSKHSKVLGKNLYYTNYNQKIFNQLELKTKY